MPTLRKIYLLTGMLALLLFFDLFGLYYIEQTYQKDDEREAAEQLSARYPLLLQELSQSIDRMGVQRDSSTAVSPDILLLQKLGSNLKQMQQVVQGGALPEGRLLRTLQLQLKQTSEAFDSLKTAYAALFAKPSPSSYQTTLTEVAALTARQLKDSEALTEQFRALEVILEGNIRMMNRLLIGSLVLSLLLSMIVLAPLFRQSVKTFKALQASHSEIKKSAALLRMVIDSSPDYIYVKDRNHCFQLANRALATDLGVEPEALIGKSELDFGVPPDIVFGNPEKGIRGIRMDNEEVLRSGQPMAPKEEKVQVKGSTMYKITMKAPVYDAAGAISGVLGYIHDITHRVEMEQQLQESERKYRCLFNENPFPMWIFDPKTMRFLEVNEKAVEHYGYTSAEFEQMSILEIRPPESHAHIQQLIETKDQKATKFHQGRWTHIKKSGERITVEITSHRVVYEGREAVLVLAQDITDKVQLEAALLEEKISHQRQMAKATIDVQETERAEIGKELHDNVNQILTSVRLQLQYTEPEHLEALRPRCVKLIDTAIQEIRQLSKSLVPPSLQDIGFINSIDDLLENLQCTQIHFGFTHAIEERSLDRGLKLTVFRIIQELTTNIIKHSEASIATIDMRQQKGYLLLRVRDNGKGFQTDQPAKGIGFQNIINRAHIYQGKVSVQAPAGKGCDVTISFRLEPQRLEVA